MQRNQAVGDKNWASVVRMREEKKWVKGKREETRQVLILLRDVASEYMNTATPCSTETTRKEAGLE